MKNYPKRLIEVDLPIRRISEHARREKSIRHGHISTLHIWWARRPLAACRAVVCASLWPDPADKLCPKEFRVSAAEAITKFAKEVMRNKKLADSCSEISMGRWNTLSRPENKLDVKKPDHLNILRYALLDFIADFSNWDNSINDFYLSTSQTLTHTAHIALGGLPGTRPLVVDPFAGGGTIPLEALRVGADAFASDLNPIAVLLNKAILEYLPKYGPQLASDVRELGEWVNQKAKSELGVFFPNDPDGSIPIAYLWARTIKCEGPSCGAEIPLLHSLWLSKQKRNSYALRFIINDTNKEIDFEIIKDPKPGDVEDGTVKRGKPTCPICGFTTPISNLQIQFRNRNGGTIDARLIAVALDT